MDQVGNIRIDESTIHLLSGDDYYSSPVFLQANDANYYSIYSQLKQNHKIYYDSPQSKSQYQKVLEWKYQE